MAVLQYVNNFSYALTGAKSGSTAYINETAFITALKAAMVATDNGIVYAENPIVTGHNNETAGRVIVPVTILDGADGETVKYVGYLLHWDSNIDDKVYLDSVLTAGSFASGDIVACRLKAQDVTADNLVDIIDITESNHAHFSAYGIDIYAPHTVIRLDSGLTSLTSSMITLYNSKEKFGSYGDKPLVPVYLKYTLLIENFTATDAYGITLNISSSFTYDHIVWESGSAPVFSSSYNSMFIELLYAGGSTSNTWIGRFHLFNS